MVKRRDVSPAAITGGPERLRRGNHGLSRRNTRTDSLDFWVCPGGQSQSFISAEGEGIEKYLKGGDKVGT